ncbi:hypothetical protein FVD15_03385 [Campylobacter volucris]|uniref:Uncharacterized protein n=1 Tax=Campylobacter volucris TaxID=1031542 RepID=A0AAE6CYW4_9BACT|nr:hypothetical protein [Campylobacter volucris]AJC94149.1 hypothetical protein CVOL_0843 [Campylobacter volucris LMG 24379]KAB0580307.1 hypothetical protein F7P61_01490 [Campylobacter volucris]QBL13479.1 hypothetical protein A9460_03695 [Campylobacter volucris]QEL08365.1 hypothetical protein CVOLT_0850 [Campylobacter volucris]TXK70516.1 hypothetical protein FVD15_03385 [Campylobacter volucris]
MKKVEFLSCLSGDIFYKKGDVVELNDKEALRLENRNIVKIITEQEEKEEKNSQGKKDKDKKAKAKNDY